MTKGNCIVFTHAKSDPVVFRRNAAATVLYFNCPSFNNRVVGLSSVEVAALREYFAAEREARPTIDSDDMTIWIEAA